MSKHELEQLRWRVADKLVRHLEPMFTDEMMLTLVARHPTNKECYIVISSDDDHAEVAKLLMKEQGGIDAHEHGTNR